MNVLLIKSDLVLDDLAAKLRKIANITDVNQCWHITGQKRESVNLGGVYYYFKVMGFIIHLLENQGEVQLDEVKDWPYFIFVERCSRPVDDTENDFIFQHLSGVLNEENINTQIYDGW